MRRTLIILSTILLTACSVRLNNYYSGFVVDEMGNIVSGVLVSKRFYLDIDYDINKACYDTTVTDEKGYFYINREKELLHYLIFSKDDYVTDTVRMVWLMCGEKEMYSPFITSDSAKVTLHYQK